jgi:hypothetical protein
MHPANRDRTLAAMREWAAEHGRLPTRQEWERAALVARRRERSTGGGAGRSWWRRQAAARSTRSKKPNGKSASDSFS